MQPSTRTALAAFITAPLLAACVVVPVPPQPSVYVPPPGAPPAPVNTTYTARLYPLNEIAAQTGMVSATVTDNLQGHGVFTLSFNNEPMQGEATRVADNSPAYGRVHQQVYGSAPRVLSGYRKGIASAAGARGSFVNCEYALNATASGTGACLFSNGAKYQLHFGS